jgi:hypothetical protein
MAGQDGTAPVRWSPELRRRAFGEEMGGRMMGGRDMDTDNGGLYGVQRKGEKG